jgi:hypothetical protein
MAGFFYYGEANGARILRANVGTTQVTEAGTEDVLLDVKTWDAIPAGPVGDNVFRSLDAVFKVSNGYLFDLTPSVDDVELLPQRFGNAGQLAAPAQAPIAERGNRVAVRIQEIERTGDVEIEDVVLSYNPIRTTP